MCIFCINWIHLIFLLQNSIYNTLNHYQFFILTRSLLYINIILPRPPLFYHLQKNKKKSRLGIATPNRHLFLSMCFAITHASSLLYADIFPVQSHCSAMHHWWFQWPVVLLHAWVLLLSQPFLSSFFQVPHEHFFNYSYVVTSTFYINFVNLFSLILEI